MAAGGGANSADARARLAMLRRAFKDISEASDGDSMFWVGLKDDKIDHWEVTIKGPDGTPFADGFFAAELIFPEEYPNMPPEMRFTNSLWHPNVYPDGKVCISILHPPGTDRFNEQETAAERWRPILSVEAIIISVISMLGDPNDASPANLDAAKQWREDRKGYNRKVRRMVAAMMEEG